MDQNNISLETVLHALYGCSNVQSEFTDAVYVCPTCAYGKNNGRPCESLHPLLEDAYVLLKAQEPVKPVLDIDTWKCGNCRHTLEHQELLGDNVLFHEQYNYCPECGKAVKWE